MAAVRVAFECEVDVMVGTLDGGLVVRAQAMVLLGKLNAMGEHVDFGFNDIVVAVPNIANEDHQPREVGDLTAAQPLRGQNERNEAKEHFQEYVEIRSLLLIYHTVNKMREFR